jgi:hypothetical protein
MNPIQVWKNWRSRLDLIASWGLRPTDVVLEVGSGQNPSPRADILCERFVADGTERHDALPRVDRPFVVGDLARLPFADGAVDFVICTHVLEHVADPAGALAELARVAPRGYVETPAAAWERMQSFPFHRWYVSEEQGTMVFEAKERPIHDASTRDLIRRLVGRPGTMDWIFQNERELGVVVGLLWEGSQPARVVGTPAPETAEGFTQATIVSREDEIEVLKRAEARAHRGGGGASEVIYRRISRRLRRHSTPHVDLEGILNCPICGGSILLDADAATCAEGHTFDVAAAGSRRIPFLLA